MNIVTTTTTWTSGLNSSVRRIVDSHLSDCNYRLGDNQPREIFQSFKFMNNSYYIILLAIAIVVSAIPETTL